MTVVSSLKQREKHFFSKWNYCKVQRSSLVLENGIMFINMVLICFIICCVKKENSSSKIKIC